MFIGSPGDRFSYRVSELGSPFDYVIIKYFTKIAPYRYKNKLYERNNRLYPFKEGNLDIKVISIKSILFIIAVLFVLKTN
jgi:hypothetical protein